MYANDKNIISFPVSILTDIFIFLQLFSLLFFAKETITQIKLFKLSKTLNIVLPILLFISISIVHLSLKKALFQSSISELNGFEKSYISYLTQFKTGIYFVMFGLLIFSYSSIAKQLNKMKNTNVVSNFFKLCFTPLSIGWLKRNII
ncbi:hypothetical protein [uncultured Algibacter sp.]|uniref:hypothetical protein n=1 Tax=uncultured Algibacter sp. TaxID=298659 RepID=UPI002606FB76|nr:hypothetical protein [uncultured Algibacter sp.]